MAPRIPPLPESAWDDDLRDLLSRSLRTAGDRPLNIFTTLAHHPSLLRAWMRFGTALLLRGALPARDRELLILRTGWLCRSDYEWGQHVLMARDAGLTDAEIERVPDGPEAPGWNDHDRTLLRAADELHHDSRISDATWEALAAVHDRTQLIEIPMLVGQYHLVAFTLNTLGVENDPGVPHLPRR